MVQHAAMNMSYQKARLLHQGLTLLRFVKGAFQNNIPKQYSNMNSPVQVEVSEMAGYISQCLITRYKP